MNSQSEGRRDFRCVRAETPCCFKWASSFAPEVTDVHRRARYSSIGLSHQTLAPGAFRLYKSMRREAVVPEDVVMLARLDIEESYALW